MSDTLLEGFIPELKVKGIIGFDGSTIKGFGIHPDRKRIIYPMGNEVIIQEWLTKKQYFLSGHTNTICSMAISSKGNYVASGQVNHIGFKAQVIIWDVNELKKKFSYDHHKVRVEAVSFSKDEEYCISLGGRDCCSILVWSMKMGQVLCGTTINRGLGFCLLTMTRREACFLTGGDNHLAVWIIDKEARNFTTVDVAMSKLRRTILCCDVNTRDEICYCGTTTGDILKIYLNFHHDAEILEPVKQPVVVGCFAKVSKKKMPRGTVDLYKNGVRSIKRIYSGELIIGAGDGTIDFVEEYTGKVNIDTTLKQPSVPGLKILKSAFINASVTSIQLLNRDTILASTTASEIYSIDMHTFQSNLLITCHTSSIYDIAFPHNFSEVFATASKDDVRVWCMDTFQELLRIKVENFSCSSLMFGYSGKCIVTAWNDGVIRSFTPLYGRLIYAILNAHNKGVSAMAITSDDKMIVSGGCEGQVRLWSISPYKQSLICTLKEHKGPVSMININKSDTEAVSASTDGTCIIWDIKKQFRRQVLFANTVFMCVKYYPTDVQILTGGSDRKLGYWEVLDGALVRELDGSSTGTINTLDISNCGNYIVSGGNDQILKLWKYQEGITTHIGLGHSAIITACKFSPNGKYIVSCSGSGSIFIWENPFVGKEQQEETVPSVKSEKIEVEVKEEKQEEEDIVNLKTSRSSICSGNEGKSIIARYNPGDGQDVESHLSQCSSRGSLKASSVGSKKSPSLSRTSLVK